MTCPYCGKHTGTMDKQFIHLTMCAERTPERVQKFLKNQFQRGSKNMSDQVYELKQAMKFNKDQWRIEEAKLVAQIESLKNTVQDLREINRLLKQQNNDLNFNLKNEKERVKKTAEVLLKCVNYLKELGHDDTPFMWGILKETLEI